MSDELRAYLLDKLTQEERSLLEERMFADDELFDRMLDAENDLVDAYAAGRLSPGDAAKFAAGTNHPPGRRNRVTVAKALFAREQTARSPGNRYRKVHLQQALSVAAALVVVSVAAWLYKAKTSMLVPSARIAVRPGASVMSIFLTSTVTRERNAAPSITLPKGTTELRVTAAVPAVTPDTALHAELRAATGNLVWQGTPQSWAGNSPTFLIPAAQLPSGAAELDVFAGAARRLVGVYPLRFEGL